MDLTSRFIKPIARIRNSSRVQKISAGIIFVLILLIATSGSDVPEKASTEPATYVNVSSVQELREQDTFQFTGTITPQNETTLRSQSQGVVTNVHTSRGNVVSKGALIAQIENRQERASVEQARARVKIAEANLAKLTNESTEGREESLQLALEDAKANLQDTKDSVLTSIESIQASINTILLSYVDPLFDSPRGPSPWFEYAPELPSGNLREKANNLRYRTTIQFIQWEKALDRTTDPKEEIRISKEFVVSIEPLFLILVEIASELETSDRLSASDINSIVSEVTTARNQFLSQKQTLDTLENTLDQAERALTKAENTVTIGVSGTNTEDIAILEASLLEAKANLSSALARLETTFIRAPQRGVITSLLIDEGDVVSPLQDVGRIAGEGGLEVSVFVSEEASSNIQLGTTAVINETITGTVLDKAPALDSTTQKREIILDVLTGSELTEGEIVTVEFESTTQPNTSSIFIPLSALKINPNERVVFIVGLNNTLISQPVITGTIQGNTIEIIQGISDATLIVEDVRGLSEGQEVIIN